MADSAKVVGTPVKMEENMATISVAGGLSLEVELVKKNDYTGEPNISEFRVKATLPGCPTPRRLVIAANTKK